MKLYIYLATFGLALSLCQAVAASEWKTAIVGKELSNGKVSVTLNPNGKLDSDAIAGKWWEEVGKYCREVTKPKKAAGTECQVVTVRGNKVTFESPSGRKSTWEIK